MPTSSFRRPCRPTREQARAIRPCVRARGITLVGPRCWIHPRQLIFVAPALLEQTVPQRATLMSMPGKNTRLIVGHANTIHDPAICLLLDDKLFAESLERHMQCKRAWE